jgi:hypothetical protein
MILISEEALELERVRAAIAEAKECTTRVRSTPFRPHSPDDVDYRAGCEQTKERIIKALGERLAELQRREKELSAKCAGETS